MVKSALTGRMQRVAALASNDDVKLFLLAYFGGIVFFGTMLA